MLKRNCKASILCVFILTFALTGCGNSIPEMTQEQNALVTEYAAGLLLEYHADYQSRLVDTSQPMEQLQADGNLSEVEQIVESTPEKQDLESGDTNPTENRASTGTESSEVTGSATSQKITNSQPTVSQILDMPDFTISYTGYEVCDSYPNEQSAPDDMFFAMRAGEGNKLVALKLQIANAKEQAQTFNTLALKDIKGRAFINGEKYNALVTMLENDFLAMEQVVNPGQSIEAVVIVEITKEQAEQIQAVQLYVRNGTKETTVDAMQK